VIYLIYKNDFCVFYKKSVLINLFRKFETSTKIVKNVDICIVFHLLLTKKYEDISTHEDESGKDLDSGQDLLSLFYAYGQRHLVNVDNPNNNVFYTPGTSPVSSLLLFNPISSSGKSNGKIDVWMGTGKPRYMSLIDSLLPITCTGTAGLNERNLEFSFILTQFVSFRPTIMSPPVLGIPLRCP